MDFVCVYMCVWGRRGGGRVSLDTFICSLFLFPVWPHKNLSRVFFITYQTKVGGSAL